MCLAGVVACAALHAQALVAGRVVDETGAGVAGARIEFRASGAVPVTASSDPAGNFSLTLPSEGEYALRAERPGSSSTRAAGPSASPPARTSSPSRSITFRNTPSAWM